MVQSRLSLTRARFSDDQIFARWFPGISFVLLFAVVVLLLGFSGRYNSGFGKSEDGADYACIARHLVNNGSFLTDVIYPLFLAFPFAEIEELRKGYPAPEFNRPPLFPLYVAATFAIAGISEGVAKVGGALPLFATAFFLAVYGRKIYGEMPALASAFLYLTYPVVLRNGFKTLSEPLATLLLVILFFHCIKHSRPERLQCRHAILSGLLSGLIILTKFPYIFTVPVFLFFIISGKKGKSLFASVWLTSLLVIVLPWLLRNAILTGDPLFTIQGYSEITKHMAGMAPYAIHRSMEPIGIMEIMVEQPFNLLRKFIHGIAVQSFSICRNLVVVVPFIGLTFVLHYIRKISGEKPGQNSEGDDRVTIVRPEVDILLKSAIALLFLAGILIPVYALLSPDKRHFIPLFPLLLIVAFSFCKRYWQVFNSFRLPLILAVLINLLHIPMIGGPRGNARAEEKLEFETINLLLNEKKPIISDKTSSTAWNTDRTVIWLPLDRETMTEVCRLFLNPAIYVSGSISGDLLDPYGGNQGFEDFTAELGYGPPVELCCGGQIYQAIP